MKAAVQLSPEDLAWRNMTQSLSLVLFIDSSYRGLEGKSVDKSRSKLPQSVLCPPISTFPKMLEEKIGI